MHASLFKVDGFRRLEILRGLGLELERGDGDGGSAWRDGMVAWFEMRAVAGCGVLVWEIRDAV